MAIIGSAVVTLYVSCEQKDTDFMAVLHDIDPEGQVTHVQRGFLRASHRALDPKKSSAHEPIQAHDKAEELTPGWARPAPRQPRYALTDREFEVLQLIADGLANREIAERLFLSEETVKSHVKTLLEKLHARSRAHAVAIALRDGVIA